MAEHRTDWLHKAKWGVMFHYLAANGWQLRQGTKLPSRAEWNRCVDAVDVERLAGQLADAGAGYLLLTVGQNSTHLCSPNETLRGLLGEDLYCGSDRDLVLDFAEALTRRGLRLLVYHHAHAPSFEIEAVERLACTPPWDARRMGGLAPGTYRNVRDADDRLSEFWGHWQQVHREWADRWGGLVHGWWIDGCYHTDRTLGFPDDDPPNYKSFAEALRAGNSEALVAFNPGVSVPIRTLTPHQDYTAGEISHALPVDAFYQPLSRWVDGAQLHVLSYLGELWRKGEPRFTDALAVAWTRHITARGGVVTWDVPVDAHCRVPEAYLRQLGAIGAQIAIPPLLVISEAT